MPREYVKELRGDKRGEAVDIIFDKHRDIMKLEAMRLPICYKARCGHCLQA